MKLIRIHPDDNVAVALRDLKAGEQLSADGLRVTAAEDIARARDRHLQGRRHAVRKKETPGKPAFPSFEHNGKT